MILELDPRRDTETPPHTHNERICETTSEETSRSVPPGAAGNRAIRKPGPPAGRPPGIHPRSTRTRRRRRCRRGCASWPGSSPAPTWSGRRNGTPRSRHRSGGLTGEQPTEPAPAARAIAQNCPKCNASGGIMSKQFLVDNGVLGHRHRREQIDHYQRQHANSGG